MRVVIYPDVNDVIGTINATAEDIKSKVLNYVSGKHTVSVDWINGPRKVQL